MIKMKFKVQSDNTSFESHGGILTLTCSNIKELLATAKMSTSVFRVCVK